MTPSAGRGVLYVANSAKIGGGNRVLMELVNRLDRSRFTPYLVAPDDGPLLEWAAGHGVEHVIVSGDDWQGRAAAWSRAARILRILLRWRPSIVHSMAHTCYGAAGLAANLTGATRICHLGCPPTNDELKWSFRSGPECIVACYDGQARDVAKPVSQLRPHCRVVSIPNGVDLSRFRPEVSSCADVFAGGRGNTPVIATVGNLGDVKGHPTFLRAAARVAAAIGNCKFLIVGADRFGEGWQKRLEQLAYDLGIADQVHFPGWQDDIRPTLHAADVVALPSRTEGLPLALLEAMACGKAVVATPVGGVPEAIIDGVTGHLVPPDDPERLAVTLIRILKDREHAGVIGAAARGRVEARFSLDRHAAAVQALYDDLQPISRPYRVPDTSPRTYAENK
jgi:glycosyltransferase involved in cell wall biosynthesis